MPEFFGPLVHVTLAGALWLIPLLPLLAAAYQLTVGVSRMLAPKLPSKTEAKEDRTRVANMAMLSMVSAFLVVAFHVQKLFELPEGERVLFEHVWRIARFGQLDVNLDLFFDPLAAVMCLVITGVGGLIIALATKSMEGEPQYWRFFAWISFLVFAMLILVLADNIVTMFLGWGGVTLATWALVTFYRGEPGVARAGMRAFLFDRLGDAALLLGAALLFWGLGGVWTETDYIPDLSPRFSSVAVGAVHQGGEEVKDRAPAIKVDDKGNIEKLGIDEKDRELPPTTGRGLLTLTSHPGALLYVDDARTPLLRGDEPLRSPFVRFPLPGGIHSFRIHPGGGLDDFLVTHVALGGEREVSLSVFGATLSFAQIRDQLAVSNAKGEKVQKTALLARKGWGNVTLITLACLLFFFGAASKSAMSSLHVSLAGSSTLLPLPASALLQSVTMGTAGIYLLARLGFLFALSSTASAVVACVGVATALHAAVAGLREYDLRRVLAYSTVSQIGLMALAIGIGAYGFAIFLLVTHAIVKTCLTLAAGSVEEAVHTANAKDTPAKHALDLRKLGGMKDAMPKTSRAFLLGTLALATAPIPGLCGFFSQNDILFAAFTTENVGKVPGSLLFVAALLACALTSFCAWRSYYLVFEGKAHDALSLTRIKESAPEITRILLVLSVLTVLAGVGLGASTRFFGGFGAAPIESWLAESFSGVGVSFARVGGPVQLGILAVSFGAAAAAWSIAKKRYGEARSADWLARDEGTPLLSGGKNARDEREGAPAEHVVMSIAMRLRALIAGMDLWVLDGIVGAAAGLTRAAAWITAVVDQKIVDGPASLVATKALEIGGKLRARLARYATKSGDDA